eukprot:g13641.t1
MGGSGLGSMMAVGGEGLQAAEGGGVAAAQQQQSVADILKNPKQRILDLTEQLELRKVEKDLFQKYKDTEMELQRVKLQVAEVQPDAGKHFVDNAFAATALYTNRQPLDEKPKEDPMFRIKTQLRPDGIKSEKRPEQPEGATAHMEFPKSGAHVGAYRPETESVPQEHIKYALTVAVNPNSDKRSINPKYSRQEIYEMTQYFAEMSQAKDETGIVTVYEYGPDRVFAVHLKSTAEVALRMFDKDAECELTTYFIDFREDVTILAASEKLTKIVFRAAVDHAAEKSKAPPLECAALFYPLGYTAKDRLSRTWDMIASAALANDGNLHRIFQLKDRLELAQIRGLLARLREDIEAIIGTEDPDPAHVRTTSAEALWKKFNMRSCMLGIAYTCGRVARSSELQTLQFYTALGVKMKDSESQLTKDCLKVDRSAWLNGRGRGKGLNGGGGGAGGNNTTNTTTNTILNAPPGNKRLTDTTELDPIKKQRGNDGNAVLSKKEKQKAFVDAMRENYAKKFDVDLEVVKKETKDCCVFHLCKLGGILNNRDKEVYCLSVEAGKPCGKDPGHTITEAWRHKHKKLRK